MKNLMSYKFVFVQNIKPCKNSNSTIKEFYPQSKYKNKNNEQLNKYGYGAFCKFSVNDKYKGKCGVYAYYIDDKLVYIGKCKDFALRFNYGYGNISPKNCYIGGQSTNCKINKIVLESLKDKKDVSIYFYNTDRYDEIEKNLIKYYKPRYNTQFNNESNVLKVNSNNTISNKNSEIDEKPLKKICTEDVRNYIKKLILSAKEQGKSDITIKSGDIHKELCMKNSMPTVCFAMRSLGDYFQYEIIEEPLKRNGSRVIYRYIIT